MKLPKITGIIDRRILINYRVEEETLTHILPEPFKPKLINGKGVVGICLIRLKNIRPVGVPKFLGIASENAAHRVAVEWSEKGQDKQGVYIPRRDTSSRINTITGGWLFPGIHHLAHFSVKEGEGKYLVKFRSEDGTSLSIQAERTSGWNQESIFDTVETASNFFEQGAIGYSPSINPDLFDGLELQTKSWKVSPLKVSHVESKFFQNTATFPQGSLQFDNALLMENIEHNWNSLERKSSKRSI